MIFDGHGARLTREHNERAWLAWHIVALQRTKKLPKLDRMLVKQNQRKRQTWQEQMHVMSLWAAVMRKVAAHKTHERK